MILNTCIENFWLYNRPRAVRTHEVTGTSSAKDTHTYIYNHYIHIRKRDYVKLDVAQATVKIHTFSLDASGRAVFFEIACKVKFIVCAH